MIGSLIDGRAGLRRAAALLVLVAASISARAGVPFEKALPEDVTVYAGFENVAALKEAYGKTQTSAMLKDPALKPFVDGVHNEVSKLLDMAQQLTGVSIPEMFTLPTGQIALAVRANPAEPVSIPYVYFLVDVKGNEDKTKALLTRLTQIAEDQGMSKSTEGDFTVVGPAEKAPRAAVVYTLKGSVLAIGNDLEALKATVAGLDSGLSGKTFADNAKFVEYRKAAGGASAAELFADLSKALEILPAVSGTDVSSYVTMFGLNAFQSLGVSMDLAKDELDSKIQLHVLTKGPTPIWNLLNMPATSMAPEAWVPADAVSYTSFNWDLEKFYAELQKLIDAISPGGLAQVESMLQGPDPDNPLLNIKNDLIGPLGNRISVVTDSVEAKGANALPTSRMLLAWQTDDSSKLIALIDRLLQLAGGALPLQDKMVKGNKVYFFPLGDLLQAQMGDQQMPIDVGVVGFTITKTHLMLATHVELLDKVLESEGKPGLAENADYQKVAAKFPKTTSGISYVRGDESFRSIYQLVKSGALAKQLKTSLEGQDEVAAFLGGIIDSLDGKNLPDYSAIKKYLTSSGGYAVQDETGLHVVSYNLAKK